MQVENKTESLRLASASSVFSIPRSEFLPILPTVASGSILRLVAIPGIEPGFAP